MPKSKIFLMALFVFICNFFILTSKLHANPQVGQLYSGIIPLPSKLTKNLYVPLPPGQWLIVGVDEREATNSLIRVYKGYAVSTSEKKLKGTVRFYWNTEMPDHGWKKPRTCTRTNIFYRWPQNYDTAEHGPVSTCFAINHNGMTLGRNPTEAGVKLYDWVSQNTDGMPKTMLSAYFRKADEAQMLIVQYYFNPEMDGFAPPAGSNWRGSDWHYSRLRSQPKKLAYMNELKSWAEGWLPAFVRGFEGKTPLMTR